MRSHFGKTLVHVRDAIAWRLHRLLGDRVVYGALRAGGTYWRRLLTKPIYIGVTGSAGKTTTKELLLGMLSHKKRGVGNYSSFSNIEEIAKAMLRLRPSHDFFVTELSGHKANEMDRPLALLQPSIGIVTLIGDDHSSTTYPRDAIAREKGKLIAALPVTGTAILNADDELVLGMAAQCAGGVITYGTSPKAELRAEEVSSVWPARLEFTLVRGSQRVKIRTQLCGSHWVPSVLGAVGSGLALGMTLEECAEGLARVPPFEGRMQPVTTADGVTFIRDDYKATLWTVDACFEFMRTARAKRKIVVVGELSDAGSRKGTKYAKVAALAQEFADITIFVGAWASSVLKTRNPGRKDALRAFSSVRDAAEYVNSITRAGDLVLLKGTNRQDHLFRIVLARNGDVACWRDDCHRYTFCNECPDRNKPSGPAVSSRSASTAGAAHEIPPLDLPTIDADEQVIVGLGNDDPKYDATPHNIGYAVADQIAASLGLSWSTTPDACIARGSVREQRICLIKIRSLMNGTGARLKDIAERMSFGPEQCILLYDDLGMSMGSVRARSSGGSGGHLGVGSILVAFQTDAFRRVKVGVGQAGVKLDRTEYVVAPIAATERGTIDQAIQKAAVRALEMVAEQRREVARIA